MSGYYFYSYEFPFSRIYIRRYWRGGQNKNGVHRTSDPDTLRQIAINWATSWMGGPFVLGTMLMEEHLTGGPVDIDKGTILHGDVIFDIPEPAAFKRYSTYQHQHLRWGLTSSWWPFWPALGPSCLLVFAFHALRALKPCDPRRYLMMHVSIIGMAYPNS